MKRVISVSGKGGSGKTTLTALLLKVMLSKAPNKSILVVDADPATNLSDVTGVEVKKTVGTVANKLKLSIEKEELSPYVSKADVLESWIYETVIEKEDFDMLVMGRTEGEGCYCYVNSILTRILDTLTKNYDITLMDMEAGLEHLSRRTDRDLDAMIIVTDPSKMGLKTTERIRKLAAEVHITVKGIYLVGNQFPAEMDEFLRGYAKEIDTEYAGIIPIDSNISHYNVMGRSLLELPEDSPAVKVAENIARRIELL